jgi:hypothetical protein
LELSRIPLNNGGDDVRTVMKRFVAERPLNVQKTNGVVFGQTKGGELEVSILQRVEDGDSVVLHTLCEDGTARSETLSRLPHSLRSADPVLLSSSSQDGSDTVRLVLHKKPQTSYLLGQQSDGDLELPAMIQRTRKSIPTVVGQNNLLGALVEDVTHRLGVCDGSRPTKRIRR